MLNAQRHATSAVASDISPIRVDLPEEHRPGTMKDASVEMNDRTPAGNNPNAGACAESVRSAQKKGQYGLVFYLP